RPHQVLTLLAFKLLTALGDRVTQEFGLAEDAWSWLGEEAALGAVEEDRPATRVLTHFHQPTQRMPLAGLLGNLSSVLRAQSPGNAKSWADARLHFLEFLRGSTELRRQDELRAT